MERRRQSLSDLAALRDTLAREESDRAKREAVARVEAERTRRETNLFRDTVGTVEPLTHARRVEHRRTLPPPIARQRELNEREALIESLSSDFEPDTILDADDQMSWVRPGIGGDVLRKLRAGQWIVQAELDLHGARVDEARDWLANFMNDAMKRHLRCLRIVHGKGHGSIGKQPVLKGKVKRWLTQKDEVLAWVQPPERDGGGGALIVLLRPC